MNQSSFFKDAGTFFIAFIIGTVSLHGMLFYLVTDATSFFSGNNNLLPLLLILVVYAAVPFALFIFRRKIFGDRLLHNYRIKNNLTNSNAQDDIDKERKEILEYVFRLEKWAYWVIGVGIVLFTIYMFFIFLLRISG